MIKFMSFFAGNQTELNEAINKWLEENPDITFMSPHQQSFLESWTSFRKQGTLHPMVYFVSFFYECPSSENLQTDLLEAAIKLEEVRQFLVNAKKGGPPIEGKIRALGYDSLEDLEIHYSHLANVTYSQTTPELDRDIKSVFTGRVLRSLERNQFVKLGQIQNLSVLEFNALPNFGPKTIREMKEQIAKNQLEELFPNLF